MIEVINEGIRYNSDSNEFELDFENNLENDLIRFLIPTLKQSDIDSNTFWFGYEFSENSTSKERADFIHFIKGLSSKKLDTVTFDRFLKRPLLELDKQIRTHLIDCFVYPKSGRSDLVTQIIRAIGDVTSRDMASCSFEAIKSIPTKITFDYEKFDRDFSDEYQKSQMLDYVDNILMPKIHNLDYFSLARDVKPKYRSYIMDYLNITKSDLNTAINLEDAENILIVDDILTTGNTIKELVRLIRKFNLTCTIYVYTLLGRSK